MSSLYNQALAAEKDNAVGEALRCYEALINSDAPPVEAFINLIFIYFQLFDPGFRTSLPETTAENVDGTESKRILALFSKAKKLYPDSLELKFWENNISLVYPWLNSQGYTAINPLFFEQHETYVPYYLVDLDNQNYSDELHKLRLLVEQGKTFKERYIRNIIGE